MKKDAGFLLGCLVIMVLPVFAICPSADLTGDCYVGLADIAALADQWLTGDGLRVTEVALALVGTSFTLRLWYGVRFL